MAFVDTQQICMNGHQITDSIKNRSECMKKFCPKCGKKTIINCPSCKKTIPGRIYYDLLEDHIQMPRTSDVPSHCQYCGKPLPWTKMKSNKRKSNTEPFNSDQISYIESICTNFHRVATQLKLRHDNRSTLNINDEYDVHDLLHALLIIKFDDIRREQWTPSYAGGSSRMDFLLKDFGIVIEVKKTREGLKNKEVGEQLIIDIEKYKKHPDCKILVCFIYDPENLITNKNELENDLNKNEGDLPIKVICVPKGL